MSSRQGSTVVIIHADSRFWYPSAKQKKIQDTIDQLNKEGKTVINIIHGNERYFGPFGNYIGEVTILWESSNESSSEPSTRSRKKNTPSYIENTYLKEYDELLKIGVITQEEFDEKENEYLSNFKAQEDKYTNNPEMKEYLSLLKLGVISQEEFDAREKAYANNCSVAPTQSSNNIELREYQELLELGVITEAEFNEKKRFFNL